jgi:hypothetical protein
MRKLLSAIMLMLLGTSNLSFTLSTHGKAGLYFSAAFDFLAENVLLEETGSWTCSGLVVATGAIKALFLGTRDLGVVEVLLERDARVVKLF